MKIRNLLFGLLTLILLWSPSHPIQIQAQTSDCLPGLSPSDCTLLNAMAANMGVPKSFNVNYDISGSLTGLASGKSFLISAKGAGLVNISGITQMTLASILQNIQLATTMQFVTSGSPKIAYDGQIDLRIVNGIIYAHGKNISENGWATVSLASLLAGSRSNADRSTLIGLFTPQTIARLCTCTTVDVTQGKTVDGPSIDGKASKLISAVIDYGAAYDKLQTDQDKQQFLAEFMTSASGETLDTTNPAQLATAEKFMRGFVVEYGWYVTPDDQTYHGFFGKVHLIPGFGVLSSLASTSTTSTSGAIDFQASVILSKIGRTVNIPPGTGNLVDDTAKVTAFFTKSKSQ